MHGTFQLWKQFGKKTLEYALRRSWANGEHEQWANKKCRVRAL